tara:strand:+ start:125 stop:475 length:351 start_codon:yes stop_codon:yes gene_type:complete
MKKLPILISSLFIITSIFIISCTPATLDSIKHNTALTIQGTITKIGNSPFEKLAIHIPKHKTSIPLTFKFQADKTKVNNNLGKKLKLNGLFQISNRKLANSNQEIKTYSLLITSVN